MHSLTRKPMNFVTYILTGLLCLSQANGCLLDSFEKVPNKRIVYELPAPWILESDATARIGGEPTNPGSVPDAKISVAVERKGTDADAKKLAQLSFANAGERDFAEPLYSERSIAGRNVYLYEGASRSGPYAILFFVQDGTVMNVILFGRLDTYATDVETLIRTLHWETTKN